MSFLTFINCDPTMQNQDWVQDFQKWGLIGAVLGLSGQNLHEN
jgi:hypothetical protein